MSRFKRRPIKYEKPWDNPNYDSQRPDKKRIPPPTPEENHIGLCYIAKNMLKAFRWRPWMAEFIDKKGNVL